MKIVVIIVTYNGEQWIRRTLQSIPDSDELEVILIDNNSSDNTCEIIQSEFSKVHLIQSERNLGFGRANNKAVSFGLKQFDPDGFLLLNQDASLDSDCIQKLADALRTGKCAIYSPEHYNGDGSSLDHGYSTHLTKHGISSELVNEITIVPFVNAAAWLVDKSVFQKVGGFDPIFKHYGEDDNFANRLLFHGLSIGIVKGARIFHDREKRSRQDKKAEFRAFLVDATNPKEKLAYTYRNWNIHWLRNILSNPGNILNIFRSLFQLPGIWRSRSNSINPSEYMYLLEL